MALVMHRVGGEGFGGKERGVQTDSEVVHASIWMVTLVV